MSLKCRNQMGLFNHPKIVENLECKMLKRPIWWTIILQMYIFHFSSFTLHVQTSNGAIIKP